MTKSAAIRDRLIIGFDLIKMEEGENPKIHLSKFNVAADEFAQFGSPRSDEDFNRHLIWSLTYFCETESRSTLTNPKITLQKIDQGILSHYHEHESKQGIRRELAGVDSSKPNRAVERRVGIMAD